MYIIIRERIIGYGSGLNIYIFHFDVYYMIVNSTISSSGGGGGSSVTEVDLTSATITFTSSVSFTSTYPIFTPYKSHPAYPYISDCTIVGGLKITKCALYAQGMGSSRTFYKKDYSDLSTEILGYCTTYLSGLEDGTYRLVFGPSATSSPFHTISPYVTVIKNGNTFTASTFSGAVLGESSTSGTAYLLNISKEA